mmetsp:Transcript_12543/g.27052  ORF Transcript_12543/g.27052 Transcript_12543/m.27052 type:complete len:173 (+) Transcript_12543:104-622(+)|eukprot:CAMPEP_0202903052 /NCGR_PEP_ID=MMETSP1392-20130828/20645_1 /ASSEMBLY_ACC=CAM_ASM_000868 /TAXON_ID=225041 /ORGANISM="Chlamydomonas chlamydogama, Strain SAG 11-48b" /LENGTH=172 /DNA_ID=CAMNT_0049590015 /DNA_START=76 /DNA_END=594 /DNA_ORIENTATION=-
MAGAGAKKRLEENRKRIQILRIILAAGVITYVAIRLIVFGKHVVWWHYAGLVLTALVEYVSFSGISAFAEPVYNDKGELIDGGSDLSMGGMCGYYHDLIYISVFVQISASFSNWFWLVYLLVPGYGLYKLFQKIIYPYFLAPKESEPVIDEATRKKFEKAEKRAQRRAQKWR